MELEPPAELVVQEGLDHGLAVLPDWHSFDVSALHSPAQDVPEMDRQTDRQAAARSAGTSEGAVIRAGVDTDPPAGWCWCLGPGRLSPWGAFKKSQRCFPLVLSLAFRTFHLFFFIKHEKY